MIKELALKHGTDKSELYHDYAKEYDILFKDIKVDKLLEIGVADGASHRMWNEVYPEAMIYGIDNDPKHYYEAKNFLMWTLGQNDPKVKELGIEVGPFDIIIDDGSHYPYDQIGSFFKLWSAVRPGGMYVIEDVNSPDSLKEAFKDYQYEIIRTKPTGDNCLFIFRKNESPHTDTVL